VTGRGTYGWRKHKDWSVKCNSDDIHDTPESTFCRWQKKEKADFDREEIKEVKDSLVEDTGNSTEDSIRVDARLLVSEYHSVVSRGCPKTWWRTYWDYVCVSWRHWEVSSKYDTCLDQQWSPTHIPVAPFPGEEWNIIKKGWDQQYLESIRKEGFLETEHDTQEVTGQERLLQQEKVRFKEETVWMSEHGNIDDFVASWERQEHVPLMTLTPETLEVTDYEKIWQER
jgi:hypothetical protein